jgi:hypothetical protein
VVMQLVGNIVSSGVADVLEAVSVPQGTPAGLIRGGHCARAAAFLRRPVTWAGMTGMLLA